jgi:hypothetical protein
VLLQPAALDGWRQSVYHNSSVGAEMDMKLTPSKIQDAKTKLHEKSPGETLHMRDDAIRAAYEWFDAQRYTIAPGEPLLWSLKDLIEGWTGVYISIDDIEVAAILHPRVVGEYPRYNIAHDLIHPAKSRLQGIVPASRDGYPAHYRRNPYRSKEVKS